MPDLLSFPASLLPGQLEFRWPFLQSPVALRAHHQLSFSNYCQFQQPQENLFVFSPAGVCKLLFQLCFRKIAGKITVTRLLFACSDVDLHLVPKLMLHFELLKTVELLLQVSQELLKQSQLLRTSIQ